MEFIFSSLKFVVRWFLLICTVSTFLKKVFDKLINFHKFYAIQTYIVSLSKWGSKKLSLQQIKILNIFLKLFFIHLQPFLINRKNLWWVMVWYFIVFVQRNIFANTKICKSVRWKRLEYTDYNWFRGLFLQ